MVSSWLQDTQLFIIAEGIRSDPVELIIPGLRPTLVAVQPSQIALQLI